MMVLPLLMLQTLPGKAQGLSQLTHGPGDDSWAVCPALSTLGPWVPRSNGLQDTQGTTESTHCKMEPFPAHFPPLLPTY